jgi:hypothetical protein
MAARHLDVKTRLHGEDGCAGGDGDVAPLHGPPFSDPWSGVRSARRKFCAAAEGPAARQSRQARAAITLGEASSLMFWRTHDGRGATPLVEALVAIIEASRAYLPPDGIGKDAFISRVLEATDNSKIIAVLAAHGHPVAG